MIEWNASQPDTGLEAFWIAIDHESIREWVDTIIGPNGKFRHDMESERFKDALIRGIGPIIWIKSGDANGFEQSAIAAGGSKGLTRRAQEIYNA